MQTTPFRKILIANRGEVAVRVIRAARRMGYRTVAVYSTVDAQAQHVQAADQAVCIGGAEAAASYLDIEALLAAAQLSGADAVHPGYGFLAENADFAAACAVAGLVFIGPSAAVIRRMGDKGQAKALMLEAGVPCVPGYQGEDQSEAGLAQQAERIGYPLMIKARAGGGGRGMRVVGAAAQFLDLLRVARSEALSAFGDGGVILEREIVDPRHVEIQIAADRYGNVIHLGERDCSVQRRHQKLIEEAPSPAVSPALRARMGAVAVQAAAAIGYENLGTMEFLLDRDRNFYFMEMNTRLQVEHPVTEAVTGLDLVELQLRIAAGQPLPIRQDDVVLRGHAIEARLCAEDPARAFLPQSGTLAAWRPADGVRVEHASTAGSAIAPHYDSMFAKLIAHGQDRDEALRRLASALEDSVALGIRTNKAFLGRCLVHPEFAGGGATTAFVARHQDALLSVDEDQRQRALAIGAVLLVATGPAAAAAMRGEAGPMRPGAEPLRLALLFDEGAVNVTLAAIDGQTYGVVSNDRQREICFIAQADGVAQAGGRVRLVCDGLLESVAFVRDGARLMYQYRDSCHELVDTARALRTHEAEHRVAGRDLLASTGGKVVAVLALAGQRVEAGQPLIVLEAMKMEHLHPAPSSGVVTAVHVDTGQHVPAGHLLAEIGDRRIDARAPHPPGDTAAD
ncbi:MAG: acetyl-CoA carboxylase biotin carboxylase subunit [Burkholderiaceae bacterium]